MKDIRNILTIKLQQPNASTRFIAHVTRCSRPVVQNYVDRLYQFPLTLVKLQTMSDSSLAEYLRIERRELEETVANNLLNAWFDTNLITLSQPHMTRRLLHEKYLSDHGNGLQYSQFCFVLRQQTLVPEVSGMFDHKAGDKLYLDFTGSKLHWSNESGQQFQEEIFIAVFGASSYHFSLPVPSQRQEDFIHATQAAFLHCGGTPNAVVPDCLKSAVTSHDGHEAVTNRLFGMFLSHYGVINIPARPYHPKDKPSVETAVKMVYTNILAKLDHKVFPSREVMLKTWSIEMDALNRKPFQKLPGSRYERFMSVDKPALKALPATPFSLTPVLSQTVQPTLTIYVPEDKTVYSVPHSLQGQKVEVLVSPSEIQVWHNHERHASHQRQPNAGKVLMTEHLAAAQKWYASRNPQELVRECQQRGPHIGKWASMVLETALHDDLAWNILTGLKQLEKTYPDRIDYVCRIALRSDGLTLKCLKDIIKAAKDIIETNAEALTSELPFHDNIRGADYYSQEGLV